MEGAQFNFVLQQEKNSILSNKKVMENLMQWSMKGNIRMKHYNFNQQFHPYQKQDFVNAFFKDPNVYTTLDTYQTSSSSWGPIGEEIEKVEYELVPTTQMSMAFFDRILNPTNGIVYEGGEIRQCMEEPINGFYISNYFGAMLLDEDSDVYSLYTKAERNEFLFRLLLHLVLGGQWCQWHNTVDPYLEVTKAIYKDVLSVERQEGKNEIKIRSVVLQVKCFGMKEKPVFPTNPGNIQNFCYLIVDPFKRSVTTLTHSYDASLNV